MNYEIEWTEIAEQELATAWLNSSDRDAVTAASHGLELRLKVDPYEVGESRTSFFHRLEFESPIAIEFLIVEARKTVIVHAVYLTVR